MRVGIIGKKVGMTQIFEADGTCVPVTVVDTADCAVTQLKTKEKDGYAALQVAFGKKKPQTMNKPLKGHFKKASVPPKAAIKEIRLESPDLPENVKPGKTLAVNMFAKGDAVDVTGISKGKGFQGVMKRYGFAGGKATHGVHEAFRHGGSVGMCQDPGRIFKNTKMPGQMGNAQRTAQNITVVDVRPKEKLLLLKGAIPGGKNSIVLIQSAKKKPAPKDRAWVR